METTGNTGGATSSTGVEQETCIGGLTGILCDSWNKCNKVFGKPGPCVKTLVRMCEKKDWSITGCDKVIRLVAMPESETTALSRQNFKVEIERDSRDERILSPKHLSLPRHVYSDALYRRIEELRPHVKWPHINPPPAKDAPEPAHPRSIYEEAQHSDHKIPPNAVLDRSMHAE